MTKREGAPLRTGPQDLEETTPQSTPQDTGCPGRWWATEPIQGGWDIEAQAERTIRDARLRRTVPYRALRSEDGRRVLFHYDVFPGAVILPVEPPGGYVSALRGCIERMAPDIEVHEQGLRVLLIRPPQAPGWKPNREPGSYPPYGGGAA